MFLQGVAKTFIEHFLLHIAQMVPPCAVCVFESAVVPKNRTTVRLRVPPVPEMAGNRQGDERLPQN